MIVSIDSEEQSDTTSFLAAMNINHFRQLIREAERDHSVACDPSRVRGVAKSIASDMKHRGMHANILLLDCCFILS